jgi:hypothetical protein
MSEDTTEVVEGAAEPTVADGSTRGEALLATRNKKMAELFKGRKYRVAQKVDLPQGQVFVTPFGHKGRHGYVLIEVQADNATQDASPEFRFVIGETVIKVAHEEYEALRDGLPEDLMPRRAKTDAAAEEPTPEGSEELSEATANA